MSIALAYLPYGVPGPQIGPGEISRHDHRLRRSLENSVIDRNARRLSESDRIEANEIEIEGTPFDRCGGGGVNLGREFGAVGEKAVRAQHEHARVPEVVSRSVKLLRSCLVGLLDELSDGACSVLFDIVCLNVAVSGFRRGRHYSECRMPPVARRLDGERDSSFVGAIHADGMVGRKHVKQGPWVNALDGIGGRGRDRRRRVPTKGLEQYRLEFDLLFQSLFRCQKAIVAVRDDERRTVDLVVGNPGQSLLEKAAGACEPQELFRVRSARYWPESSAAAACDDHRYDAARHVAVIRRRDLE